MNHVDEYLLKTMETKVQFDSSFLALLETHSERSMSATPEIEEYVPSSVHLIRTAIDVFMKEAAVEKLEGMTVVEEACGIGLASLMFASLGAEVHAYDVEPKLIGHAKDVVLQFTPWLKGSVEFYEGKWENEDILVDKFPLSKKFDVWYAYPWPEEQKDTALRFLKYTKPGAYLIMNHTGCYGGDLSGYNPEVTSRNHHDIEGLTLQWDSTFDFAIYRNDKE